MTVLTIRRGDIFWVSLSGSQGREIDLKVRPAVVVSINDINTKPLVVAVVPGTRTAPRHFRNVVHVRATPENGLNNDTTFLCHQIRALDHDRFQSRCGTLDMTSLRKLETAVKYSLGLAI